MERKRILPFYMTYPMPIYDAALMQERYGQNANQMDQLMEDMEYFQQMYPVGAKRVLKEVKNALSIMDYDGSMIYDEYPDQIQLMKMAKDILAAMQSSLWDGESVSEEEAMQLQKLIGQDDLEDYITVILFHEILRKRHFKNKNHRLRF